MKLPLLFSRYIAWQVFLSFIIALGAILIVVGLGELVEMNRRAAHKTYDIPYHTRNGSHENAFHCGDDSPICDTDRFDDFAIETI